VRVRLPFGTIAILKGNTDLRRGPFFREIGRAANLWLAVLSLTFGATDWNIFPLVGRAFPYMKDRGAA